MNGTIQRTLVLLALGLMVLLEWCGCSQQRSELSDLDVALRGKLSPEIWNDLPRKSKHLRCLDFKISEMRELVSVVPGPSQLVEYYPQWVKSLHECSALYPIEEKRAEQLREAVGTEMANVLGEEVSSYLTYQRLYPSESPEALADRWRILAIVGIANVSEVLPEEP